MKWHSILLSFGLVLVFSTSVFAATLATNFKTKGEIVKGNVVSLDKDAGSVVRANRDNIINLYGVVVDSSDVSFSQASGGVSVASTGVINTLVSDINGPIKSGDAITVDAVEGVGEKALGTGKIVGIAQGSFDGEGGTSYTISQNGQNKVIKIGTVPVKVEVSNYGGKQGSASAVDASANRNKVLQTADGLAGKPVKVYALVIAALFVLVGGFISTFLITSSGYASMISVGRNPLSERKILRALIRLLAIAVGIFVSGLVLAYITIKIF